MNITATFLLKLFQRHIFSLSPHQKSLLHHRELNQAHNFSAAPDPLLLYTCFSDHIIEFNRRKCFYMKARTVLFDLLNKISEVMDIIRRMNTSHNMNLCNILYRQIFLQYQASLHGCIPSFRDLPQVYGRNRSGSYKHICL